MASCGPAKSEDNLTPSPGFQGANQGASLVLPRAAKPSSDLRSIGGSLAQDNESPSQGNGTNALGNGPFCNSGQSCPTALEHGPLDSQVEGCPVAQGNGPLSSLGQGCPSALGNGRVCKSTTMSSGNSADDTDSNDSDKIYKTGKVIIVINTILCFIATKKTWARMILCEQIKKLYSSDMIVEAHNLVIKLGDSRKPRLTTRDTKRMINFIVHNMLDYLVPNSKLLFVTETTDTPVSDWSPKKAENPLTRYFKKYRHQEVQTFSAYNNLEDKVDLLIDMFTEQQSTLNKLCGKQDTSPTSTQDCSKTISDSFPDYDPEHTLPPYQLPPVNPSTPETPTYLTFPFSSPTPSLSPPITPITSTMSVPPTPTTPSSQNIQTITHTPIPPPRNSQKEASSADDLAECQPAVSAPRPTPRKHFPKIEKIDTTTQVTPKRNKKKRNSNNNNKKEKEADAEIASATPPPNRHWDDAIFQDISGLPPPTQTVQAARPVIINNILHSKAGNGAANSLQAIKDNYEDDEGFVQVISKSRKRMRKHKEKDNLSTKPLIAAPKPKVAYLYVTNCHVDTNEEDIEGHFLKNFTQLSDVLAYKCVMTHAYYSSFTVTIKGKDVDPDDILKSDSFPDNVKVFLNRNKNKNSEQRV